MNPQHIIYLNLKLNKTIQILSKVDIWYPPIFLGLYTVPLSLTLFITLTSVHPQLRQKATRMMTSKPDSHARTPLKKLNLLDLLNHIDCHLGIPGISIIIIYHLVFL